MNHIETLLRRLAEQVRPCRHCGALLAVLRAADGQTIFAELDGHDHATRCPSRQPKQQALMDVAPDSGYLE